MPALEHPAGYLAARQQMVSYQNGRRVLSTQAIGFLVPLFIVFFLAPFLCVCFIRGRRRNVVVFENPTPVPDGTKLAEKRETARQRLKGVTDVIDVAIAGKPKGDSETSTEENEVAKDVDASSIFDRDCAICLSTLHAPSPPEPAILPPLSPEPAPATPSSTTDIPPAATSTGPTPTTNIKPPSKPSSIAEGAEEILKLHVCGHEFHAECLVGWMVFRKYSCPICRAVYYVKEQKEEEEGGEVAAAATGGAEWQAQVPALAQTQTQTQTRRQREAQSEDIEMQARTGMTVTAGGASGANGQSTLATALAFVKRAVPGRNTNGGTSTSPAATSTSATTPTMTTTSTPATTATSVPAPPPDSRPRVDV